MSDHPTQHQKPSAGLHCTEDARRLARRRVPRLMFDYVDGAAGREIGERLNRSAIESIRLQPRSLVNVDQRSIETRIFGKTMTLPFGIAPMGMCNLTWPGADGMLAAEAARHGFPICLSTVASTTIEEMWALSQGQAWFQLYVGQSLEAGLEMADRAAAAGYEFLLLTVDVPQVSRRIRDLRNGFLVPFRIGPRQFLDFACHPRWSVETLIRGAPKTANVDETKGGKASKGFVRSDSRGRVDWYFLDQLRQRWKGKLIVKGVLSPVDAVRIKDAGADAVYVSNHGARQLDSAPPAIQALPLVRDAVGPDYPLIFDSGLRSGEDIVKAYALGADFVMLGRPMLYAIGADGARGLATLIDILADEISVVLAQIGRTRIDDLDGSVLARPLEAVAPMDGDIKAPAVADAGARRG